MIPFRKPTKTSPKDSTLPLRKQGSLGAVRPAAKWITTLLWITAFGTFIWGGIVDAIKDRVDGVWADNALHRGSWIDFGFDTYALHEASYVVYFNSIAISLAIQLISTFSLHCTELLVNATRDEKTRRRAANLKGKGAMISRGAIKEACTSWETISLFIIKTAVHWAFGESPSVSFSAQGTSEFLMWPNALFVLGAMMIVAAVFSTFLCYRRYSGPQPAAYGHLQTIVNFIDEWGPDGRPLYWGDKGPVAWGAGWEVRHAGTAGEASAVAPIRMDARYT
ncbi:uncharacterized protein KY384_001293 [Bacidia gigantensis]|uniref:uncharacterized protein n=1 Tax=Bacidia gigantensis TaxID=2732470 RepID=UPI001D04E48D|nr:uncharacterized protein KY384_001293 [Bacidia gigantensis]KAG8533553.1 hypothetical protein KY384_001293 [Bacidia gigantensis]